MRWKCFFMGLACLGVMLQGVSANEELIQECCVEQCEDAMANIQPIDVLLLMALPASGKSEVRRYLSSLSPEECANEFGIKDTVQLDDFPYVHVMRRVSEEMVKRRCPGAFFLSSVLPFKDPREWGVLIQLLNEDYNDLVKGELEEVPSAAIWLFDRIDVAHVKLGMEPVFSKMSTNLLEDLVVALEEEAKNIYQAKAEQIEKGIEGKTIVIEFARGGPHAASMPLPAPYGYEYSLSQFSHEILKKASILYIWVSPEESRRKNEARSDPNDPGSILHHSVPLTVMYGDYGCDDIAYLLRISDQTDTVRIYAHDNIYHLPLGRFDNRIDKTTFIREDRSLWNEKDVLELQSAIQKAFAPLVQKKI